MDAKEYERCEFIIRRFMSAENPSPQLAARFRKWLLDGRNCAAKNLIMRELFAEALSDRTV